MSREDFRRELGRAFDAMSGPPSPALSARVRSALSEKAPARPGPFWIAGLAAGLIAAIVVGVFVVSNFNRHLTSGVPGTLPSASPSAPASASANPGPSVSPTPVQTPPDSSLPPFVCGSGAPIDSQNPPAVAFIDAVRTGTHAGYDRITIEFNNGAPSRVEVAPQSGATFTQSPSGQTVTLGGSAGILIIPLGHGLPRSVGGPARAQCLIPANTLE